jgi:ribosomal protein L7Ae-like RNA K-turn-binding protein
VGCGERIAVSGRDGGSLGKPSSAPKPPEATDLVRLVLGPNGEIAVDARGGAFGRGAHVHARAACLDRAVRGGLARSTKGRAAVIVGEDGERHPLGADALARAIQEAMARRIEGLLSTAVRSRHLARGSDAVTDAWKAGEAGLVMVACDAPAAAELWAVREAVAAGKAVAWGDKLRLGRIVSSGNAEGAGVAVVALLSRPLAEAVRQAVQIADGCAGVAALGEAERGGGRARRGGRGAKGRDREQAGGPAKRERRARAVGRISRRRLSGVRSHVERGA